MSPRFVGAAALFCALAAVWFVCNVGGDRGSMWASDILTPLAALGGALAATVAARRSDGATRTRRYLMAAALWSWFVAEAIWGAFELGAGKDVPFPSVADVFYLGAIPLAAAAVLRLPGRPSAAVARARLILDGLLAAVALSFVAWDLLLREQIRTLEGSLLAKSISIAYPIADVVLVTMALYAAVHAMPHRRRATFAIAGALSAIGVGDSVYAYLTMHNAYRSGSIVDLAWITGYLALGLAVLDAVGTTSELESDERPRVARLVMAYIPLAFAIPLAIYSEVVRGGLDPVEFWVAICGLTLLSVRQFFELFLNVTLSRSLEEKVEERTAELGRRERRFSSLVQNSYDLITIIDREGTITYLSESVERLLGSPQSQLLGSSFWKMCHPDDVDRLQAALDARHAGPIALRLRTLDGAWRFVETVVTDLLADPSVNGIVFNTRDVTERTSLERRLEHQAFHDALTGLANRSLLHDRLNQALHHAARRDQDVAVLMLDVDFFKDINDTFGHPAGDAALVLIANRLRSCARPEDTIARLGGDEFAVVIEGGRDVACRAAERILDAFRPRFTIEGREVSLGASIGIASAPARATTVQELLRGADVALYVAKGAGRGRAEVFEPAMQEAVAERVELEVDLRSGLERGDFEAYYQPIVDLRVGRIVGVEALARWNHPIHGLVNPGRFIPVAEAAGLVDQIDRTVMRDAGRRVATWNRDRETPLFVDVNVSAKEFGRATLPSDVANLLNESGLRPEDLVLEITESALLEDTDRTISRLRELKGLGVRLAIDDFGVGYSGLKYLQRFPVDVLKIDGSFVRDITRGPEDGALVKAIVSLARTFGLRAVAEGVERDEQRTALVALGCDHAQGFLFAEPCSAGDMATLLAAEDRSATQTLRAV